MFKKKTLYEKAEENKNKLVRKFVKRLYKEAVHNINFAIENGIKTTNARTFPRYMSLIRERSDEQEEIYNRISELLKKKYGKQIETEIVPTGYMCSYRSLEIKIVK